MGIDSIGNSISSFFSSLTSTNNVDQTPASQDIDPLSQDAVDGPRVKSFMDLPAASPPPIPEGAPPSFRVGSLMGQEPKVKGGINPDRALPLFEGAGTIGGDADAPVEMPTPQQLLEATPSWKRASEEQRRQLSELQRIGDGMAFSLLADNQPDVLFSTAKDGKTTLEHLYGLATHDLHPALARGGVTREDLMTDVSLKLLAPGTTEKQGENGTCGATSVSRELAAHRPADYAAAMEGLVSTEGKGKLPGGLDLYLQTEYFDMPKYVGLDKERGRGPASAIMQAALMEAADPDAEYDAALDWSTYAVGSNQDGSDMYQGLKASVVNLMSNAFDKPYEAYTPEKAFVKTILHKRADTQEPVMLMLGSPDGEIGGHATMFLRSEKGRVYFYDPNVVGSNYVAAGARPEGNGEFSFSSADARKHIFGIVAPKALIEGKGGK